MRRTTATFLSFLRLNKKETQKPNKIHKFSNRSYIPWNLRITFTKKDVENLAIAYLALDTGWDKRPNFLCEKNQFVRISAEKNSLQ